MHLQILLGRERGRVYALERGSYTVGRASGSGIVLASDLVSRNHAHLVVGRADLRVTDVGSQNGTYVNGARVLGDGFVGKGDVLLIGEVGMRLHGAQVPALQLNTAPHPSGQLGGSLIEVPPSTVLRHLAVLKKTAVLLLTSPPIEGAVTFARGHISQVLLNGRRTRDPIQALSTILRWRGTFQLHPTAETSASLLLGLDALLPAVGSASRPSTAPKPR